MQIKVEEFFNLFFSDDVFTESFHRSCGDKGKYLELEEFRYLVHYSGFLMVLEYRGKSLNFLSALCLDGFMPFSELKCTPWHLHETFGHTRDVSFQHPIKLYFGMAALYVFAFLHCHLLHEFITRAYMLCRMILFYVSLVFALEITFCVVIKVQNLVAARSSRNFEFTETGF